MLILVYGENYIIYDSFGNKEYNIENGNINGEYRYEDLIYKIIEINMNKCQRCNKITYILKGSYFNQDMICDDCLKKEMNHPLYDDAKRIENLNVRNGNFNFPGIGLPEDLK